MGFLDWLTGNSTVKRNNDKIARIKKEEKKVGKKDEIDNRFEILDL